MVDVLSLEELNRVRLLKNYSCQVFMIAIGLIWLYSKPCHNF